MAKRREPANDSDGNLPKALDDGLPDPRERCPTCKRPLRALTVAERQERFRRRQERRG